VTTLPALDPISIRRVQKRTLWVLSTGLVLNAMGMGAAFSLGSLIVVSVSGSVLFAGLSAAMSTLGAAVFAIPLAALAARSGRRPALTTGALIALTGAIFVVVAMVLGNIWLLLLAMLVLGTGNALSMQTRFAAGDLSTQQTRGRDISLVVWATTIGIVLGPNLAGPGDVVGNALGLPTLSGAFVFTVVAQILAAAMYFWGLRPDPLVLSKRLLHQQEKDAGITPPKSSASFRASFTLIITRPQAAVAVFVMIMSHATMVSIMAMTPVHLSMMNIAVVLIGLTVSLHTAGMYALSPVFGWLSDRIGLVPVILAGQVMFVGTIILNWFWPENLGSVMVALILLGLGWSAATVAGSVMLTGALNADERPRVQGVSDSLMSLAGAGGGALAGVILAALGYPMLNVIVLWLVLAVIIVVLVLGWRKKAAVTA
jgi:MFS family permease